MAKTKEKQRKKKKNHSKSKEDKVDVKEKKISKKHKHISEKPEKNDKSRKKSKKTKKKHKEFEKSEVPKSEIVAPHNPPSIPTLIAANESDSGSEYDPVDLRQLLDSYSKEELVDLICTNAEKGCRLISAVHELADRDVSLRKIFVRGLGWDTTRESLETAFEPYGEIEECTVIMDKDTGRAKGYGFVLFKTRKGARKALKSPQKKMYNRTVICNLASERPPGVGKGREMIEQVKIDLTQMATATATATGTNHSEVSGFELGHGHMVNNAPQPDPRSALFAGQSMPFFGQPHGFNPMYGAMMGNQVVAGLPNYAVFGSGMMNQGLMVPPNQMGMMGQYTADGNSNGGRERAWYLRQ